MKRKIELTHRGCRWTLDRVALETVFSTAHAIECPLCGKVLSNRALRAEFHRQVRAAGGPSACDLPFGYRPPEGGEEAYFEIAHRAVIFDKELTTRAREMYILLASLSRVRGFVCISRQALMRRLNWGKTWVSRGVKELVEKKIVTTKNRGSGLPRMYYVQSPAKRYGRELYAPLPSRNTDRVVKYMEEVPFSKAYRAVLQDARLNATKQIYLLALEQFEGGKETSYPSQEWIGKAIGLSERQIRRVSDELEADGFIMRHRNTGRSAYIYRRVPAEYLYGEALYAPVSDDPARQAVRSDLEASEVFSERLGRVMSACLAGDVRPYGQIPSAQTAGWCPAKEEYKKEESPKEDGSKGLTSSLPRFAGEHRMSATSKFSEETDCPRITKDVRNWDRAADETFISLFAGYLEGGKTYRRARFLAIKNTVAARDRELAIAAHAVSVELTAAKAARNATPARAVQTPAPSVLRAALTTPKVKPRTRATTPRGGVVAFWVPEVEAGDVFRELMPDRKNGLAFLPNSKYILKSSEVEEVEAAADKKLARLQKTSVDIWQNVSSARPRVMDVDSFTSFLMTLGRLIYPRRKKPKKDDKPVFGRAKKPTPKKPPIHMERTVCEGKERTWGKLRKIYRAVWPFDEKLTDAQKRYECFVRVLLARHPGVGVTAPDITQLGMAKKTLARYEPEVLWKMAHLIVADWHAICDEWRGAWKAGSKPKFKDFVALHDSLANAIDQGVTNRDHRTSSYMLWLDRWKAWKKQQRKERKSKASR